LDFWVVRVELVSSPVVKVAFWDLIERPEDLASEKESLNI
jgi:hypothetical protein